jgi:hypothetical protein
VVSTTQDRVLLDAIAFLLAHKGLHSKWLAASRAPLSEDDRGSLKPLDLSVITELVATRDTKVARLQIEHDVGKSAPFEVTAIDTLYHGTPIFIPDDERPPFVGHE